LRLSLQFGDLYKFRGVAVDEFFVVWIVEIFSLVVGRRLVCLVLRGSLCCEVYVEFYDSAVSFFLVL
jgi:hypothetical protein